MKQGQEGGEMNMNMNMNMNTNTNKPQAQEPQKCPRCDSLNTKFCYYNNYSLSQPRYFCKTCRRYWTQGGTLRNVRVGGGCRKAKRAKSSDTPSSSAADPPQQQPPPVAAVQKDSLSVMASASSAPAPAVAAPAAPAISPFYHGGGDGYLSSLAAIQSLSQSQPFSQMGTSPSNMSLLSGFGVPSLGSPIRPSQQFYQMGIIRDKEEDTLYEAGQGLIKSSNWPGSFISDANHKGSDPSVWSSSMSTNTSTGGNSENNNDATASGSLSLIPSPHWPDLSGYHPPS